MKRFVFGLAAVIALTTAGPALAGGGIISLTAHGAQDVYLTGEPHKKHEVRDKKPAHPHRKENRGR
jgi:hypothetical protein